MFEEQPVPARQRRAAEVEARVVVEVRCAQQLAAEIVGPAMQRTDDVAAGAATMSAAVLDDRLAMAADVRQERDAVVAVPLPDQHATVALVRQRMEVADLRHHQVVADVAGRAAEEQFDLAGVLRRIEIRGDRQAARDCARACPRYPDRTSQPSRMKWRQSLRPASNAGRRAAPTQPKRIKKLRPSRGWRAGALIVDLTRDSCRLT